MIEPASVPPSVLVKIASLEQHCIGLGTKLEAARRELQQLRVELRDLTPREVYDEKGANEESDRLIAESQRLNDAITAQATLCEWQEKRLRAEESVIRSCKEFLHGLPANAQLRGVDGKAGHLGAIRERIKEVGDEISQVQRTPVLADDLGERIALYVESLAEKAAPIVTGIGYGEAFRATFPLYGSANRVHQTGFSENDANVVMMAALLQPERLAERLLRIATESGITASEREMRLRALRSEEVRLRYDEELAVCAAIARGDDATRSATAPAWSVLMIEVEHGQQAAEAA